MRDRSSELSPLFKVLGRAAAEQNLQLHQSFFEELFNYSTHYGVNDLPEREFRVVILAIGRKAIEQVGHRVGGGHVRNVVHTWCSDAFESCGAAARHALELRDIAETETDRT